MDLHLLAALIANAAVDSVNPCTFYVYTVLLLATAIRERTGRAVARVAAAFTGAVYIGYLAIGLSLAAATTIIPVEALAAAALAYAAILAIDAVAEMKGRRIRLLHPGGRLAGRAVRAAASPAAAFALGLLASFTLLPCSSGPLLAFIALARAEGTPLPVLAGYLALYNLVFVAPLLAIGLGVAAVYRARRVQEVVEKYSPQLSLTAAVLLAAIGLWILFKT